MSFHWQTPAMIAALQAACPGKKIHNLGQGGDFDTDQLLVEVARDRHHIAGFYISGYTPETVITDPSDHHVTHVTLGDGMDSSGGLNSDDHDMIDTYAQLRKKLADLLKGTNVAVYDSHDEFF